ncbi:MAG TPA: hypothetical protein VJS11_07890 [Acidobacteriaceae bacterium]|nr:hypothetical protein [Acidobacteriaceae bacterium]
MSIAESPAAIEVGWAEIVTVGGGTGAVPLLIPQPASTQKEERATKKDVREMQLRTGDAVRDLTTVFSFRVRLPSAGFE